MDIGLLTLGLLRPNSNGASFEGKALSEAGELKLHESTDPFAPLGLYSKKTKDLTKIFNDKSFFLFTLKVAVLTSL